ncbi:MAG TPA: hypothetical protein VFX76_05260 [Roseiflexaceae bacterium]|nr:hypothetical protein [Roseiflexaceae bacterium]
MVDIELARRLKRAGLVWQPAERDCFLVPDRGMDDQVFVVNHLTTLIQNYKGQPTVTFHGTSEWALDDVLLTEVVWLPSETQLREALAQQIGPDAPLRLDRTAKGYRCQIADADQMREFNALRADDAYALAVLALLEEQAAE